MLTFSGRKNPIKFNQINFSPCNDESVYSISQKDAPGSNDLKDVLDLEEEMNLNGADDTDVFGRFIAGLNKEMTELAREIVYQNKELEAKIHEFVATYRPLEELLREELMKKTYGRVWITIEALTDDCTGKIVVNSVVQNI